MLTDKDIKKLIKANKEVFATKKDIEGFRKETRKSFSELLTAIDAYAAKADTYFQEMLMLAHKVDRLEKWILQIAEKIGIQLAP